MNAHRKQTLQSSHGSATHFFVSNSYFYPELYRYFDASFFTALPGWHAVGDQQPLMAMMPKQAKSKMARPLLLTLAIIKHANYQSVKNKAQPDKPQNYPNIDFSPLNSRLEVCISRLKTKNNSFMVKCFCTLNRYLQRDYSVFNLTKAYKQLILLQQTDHNEDHRPFWVQHQVHK